MPALLFHHCRPLEHCSPEMVFSNREHSEGDGLDFFPEAYEWLAERIGYWPLFLSVGARAEAWYMTGYATQWEKVKTLRYQEGRRVATYVQPGEFDSLVMFSFAQPLGQMTFSDYHWWHCVLNGPEGVTQSETKKILQPGRKIDYWLRKAKRSPGSVQAHVPGLDLSRADQIWCRSLAAKKELVEKGFGENLIQIRRLPVVY